MFKTNDKHGQSSLFGIVNQLPETLMDELKNSIDELFYRLIFSNIPEDLFAGMDGSKPSRPNTPVNVMIDRGGNSQTDEQVSG